MRSTYSIHLANSKAFCFCAPTLGANHFLESIYYLLKGHQRSC